MFSISFPAALRGNVFSRPWCVTEKVIVMMAAMRNPTIVKEGHGGVSTVKYDSNDYPQFILQTCIWDIAAILKIRFR